MSNTTMLTGKTTLTFSGEPQVRCPDELYARYDTLISEQRLSWTDHHRLMRRLGAGGQGVVYLVERRGADQFTLPVALKIFSPERYEDGVAYDAAMAKIAAIAARIALIQQDNLLDVRNFIDRNRIRLMEMEWVDGYDLGRILTKTTYHRVRERVSQRRWDYINNVIVTDGISQPRLKPGIAIAIIRQCLAALAALHREGIVHGDIKPSNIMLKRTGNAKIIDVGAAFEWENAPPRQMCTPAYAAPEVLDAGQCLPQSDLCSLGYVLVEMLAGMPPFLGVRSLADLLEAKRTLVHRLPEMLPKDVVCNDLLLNICRQLIAPDPMRRFPSAEAADLVKEGAAAFQRQLIKSDLASEYENEIRLWLEELD